MKNKKKYIIITVAIIFALITSLLLLHIKKTQVESYSISDNSEDMRILETLLGKEFIRKNNGNYELLKYEELTYNNIKEIKNLEVPSRFWELINSSDLVIKNTYKNSTTPEQIVINYLALVFNKTTLEDTDNMNKKLKNYNKELDYLEDNSYLNEFEAVILASLVDIFSMMLFIFVIFCLYKDITDGELKGHLYRQLFVITIDLFTVALMPLALYYVVFVVLFVLRTLLNCVVAGIPFYTKHLIVRDFEKTLE